MLTDLPQASTVRSLVLGSSVQSAIAVPTDFGLHFSGVQYPHWTFPASILRLKESAVQEMKREIINFPLSARQTARTWPFETGERTGDDAPRHTRASDGVIRPRTMTAVWTHCRPDYGGIYGRQWVSMCPVTREVVNRRRLSA